MISIFFGDAIARRSLLQEARCEILRLVRAPAFIVPTLLFPAMFYVLFGVLLNGKSYQAAHYLLASYTVFGVMSPGLFGFGVSIALERERGLLQLKRALPMPPANYLLAKLAMAVLFAAAVFLTLALVGATLGGVRQPLEQWFGLLLVALVGVLPFCALGLMVGSLVSAQGAPAVVNLIYLPMAFLSGLWVPIFLLPPVVQKIAPALPAYHLAQLGYAVTGQPTSGSVAGHLAYLALFTTACFVFARRRLARVG